MTGERFEVKVIDDVFSKALVGGEAAVRALAVKLSKSFAFMNEGPHVVAFRCRTCREVRWEECASDYRAARFREALTIRRQQCTGCVESNERALERARRAQMRARKRKKKRAKGRWR